MEPQPSLRFGLLLSFIRIKNTTQVANPGHDDILQDEGSALQMGEQTQGFVDQIGFTNMYSFE